MFFEIPVDYDDIINHPNVRLLDEKIRQKQIELEEAQEGKKETFVLLRGNVISEIGSLHAEISLLRMEREDVIKRLIREREREEERKREEEESRRKARLEREQKEYSQRVAEDRANSEKIRIFEGLVRKFDELKIDEVAKILELDIYQLKRWLALLPDKYGIKIRQNVIYFSQEDLSAYIDELIASFSDFQKKI
ncbi:MAG: hypothetical protein ACFFD4_36840 [Candidatus Odinarchaeota archaeon]